jgi:23S rRNA (uracil1939-C5)-methyltransferase
MKDIQNQKDIELVIKSLGINGEGIAHVDGYTIFVEKALPEETVLARIFQKKKKFARAVIVKIIKESPLRKKPPCPYFSKCGGCQLMHISYDAQLKYKQDKVKNDLEHIGKIKDFNISPTIPSDDQLFYRNKIQLPVRGKEKIQIGLYGRYSNDLIDIDNCPIHCELGNKIFKKIKSIIENSKIQAYDPATNTGFLRHVLIKTAVNTNQVLVIFVTRQNRQADLLKNIANELFLSCDEIKGVVQNINNKNDNVILGNINNILRGSSDIEEDLSGLVFKISPNSFFQVNTKQAQKLYNTAIEFGNISKSDNVLDAYCGVGTLSLLLAKKAKKVTGVENVKSAINNAKTNAKNNKIENVNFICANSEDYIKKAKNIDIAYLNPPRSGCDKSFLETLIKLKPKTIVYISCDTATLSRDISLLKDFYKLEKLQPIDMFPQTSHVENVAKLTRK